jgi:NADH-quinone oxidoreductase subunit L
MVMALGLGGVVAGMYHLTTHAFFKALLFLSVGSVIHATHQQNIWKLGGLHTVMPLTSWSFIIGALALSGFPGISGFYSKDEILVLAHEHDPLLYAMGTATAGMTAFYIARAWLVAFARTPESPLHAHESPPVMAGPLIILMGLSLVGGYLGIPAFLGQQTGQLHAQVAISSSVAIVIGFGLAWVMYARRALWAKAIARRLAWLSWVLERKYGVDQLYDWYVQRIQQRLFAGTCQLFERFVIIGLAVNGTAWMTKTLGRIIRRCQTGMVQSYVLVFFAGIVVLVYLASRP